MCNTLINPVCIVGHVIGSLTSSAAGNVLDGIAHAISDGVVWVVKNTATWWVRIPSLDLATEPAVARLQQWLLPVTVAVAVAAVIAAGARMALMRKANPLLDMTGGLLTLAAATALGTVIPALLLKAGDAWSTWVLQVSTGGQFTNRLALALTLGSNAAAPAVILIFGTIAIVLSIVQAVLMLFRQAALIILAGVLPLAAAGSIAPMTRPWIRKISSWMLALIFYKAAAAAVYASAFTLIGSGGSLQTVLMGFVMMLLSVLALPALMKFFTWTTGAVASTSSGGQLLGAAAVGAFALGAMPSSRGGGSAAQDQAAYMNSRFGPSPGGSAPGGDPAGAGSGLPGGPPSPGGWPPDPSGAAPAAGPSGGRASGAAGGAVTTPSAPGTTTTPTGAADSTASGAAGSTPAGSSAAAGAATSAAPGGAASAGAAGSAAAASAQAASTAAHLASGAMEPEDRP